MLAKNFCQDGQARKQDALGGCGISIHGNNQNLTDMTLQPAWSSQPPLLWAERSGPGISTGPFKPELFLDLEARSRWNAKSSANQSVPSYSNTAVSRLRERARQAPFLEALRDNSFCTEKGSRKRNTQQHCHPLTCTLQKFSMSGTCLAASIRMVSLLLSLKASDEGNEVSLAIF